MNSKLNDVKALLEMKYLINSSYYYYYIYLM